MTPNVTDQPWRKSLARSAVVRAAGLAVFGFVGWLRLFPPDGSTWRAVSLVAVLALSEFAGVTWYLSHARAERRWWAAMDHYVDQELAKETHPRRDTHARPEAQGRGTGGGAGL